MDTEIEQATKAYIDALGPEALAKAAAYTTGNHWLLLWGLLVTALTTWIIVRSGVLERVGKRIAERRNNLAVFVIALVFMLVSSLLYLPWELYADLLRNTGYGLTSQPLGDWLRQSVLSMLIGAVLGGLFFVGLYALIRKTGRLWWLWASAFTFIAMSAALLASPVFIEPLFNEFTPVPEGEVREAISEMAEASGIPPDRIFMYDGSRQSNNFTANVSGIGASARIAISDIALQQADLDEVKAVTGHEVGHYVLGHVWQSIALFSGLAIILFFVVDRLFDRFARLFGSGASLANPVGMPVLVFIVSLLLTLLEPAINAHTRKGEAEADNYSYQTVGLPDAMASALVKTAEYRNPRPGAVEEVLFYTHPSVERRVRAAMAWKFNR